MQRPHFTVCAVCSACVTIKRGFHPSQFFYVHEPGNLTTVDDAGAICSCRVDTNTNSQKQIHTCSVQCQAWQGLHLSRWREPPTHFQLLYNTYCITAESNRPPPCAWTSNTLSHSEREDVDGLLALYEPLCQPACQSPGSSLIQVSVSEPPCHS